jgi:hypothetical protein
VATEQVYILIFGAVVLTIVFVALLLLALQRLRRRKAQLLSELSRSPRFDSDRAFNRLEMARREADIVARQGTDVAHARDLVAQAQSAFDLRQFDRAYELAQSAHESLVSARQGGRLPSAPVASSEPMSVRSGPRTAPVANSFPPSSPRSTTPLPSAAAPAPARNRMESQFEMRLLDSDLETAQQAHPSDPATLAGVEFQSKARSAFAAGEYTDAFRYALKGRRGLGGRIETVAPGPGTRPGDGAAVAVDPAQAAETAASAARCSNCGYPTTPDDVFCRGCGTPRAPSTCARCGTPRTPSDTFCGRCGERFS